MVTPVRKTKNKNMNPYHAAYKLASESLSKRSTSHSFISLILGGKSPQATLADIQHQILELQNGTPLFQLTQQKIRDENPLETPVALVGTTESSTPWLFKTWPKTKYTSVLIFETEHIETGQDLAIEFFKQVWKCLVLQSQIERNETNLFTKEDNVYLPQWTEEQDILHNMLGDAFAGIFMELTGTKNMLSSVARKRCLEVFTIPDWEEWHNGLLNNTDRHPFPMIFDIAQITLNDMVAPLQRKSSAKKALEVAIKVTDEIQESIKDENKIVPWKAFVEPAQEMAFAQDEISHILGAAIYTSDNIHNRSTAYIISDILRQEPSLTLESDTYNAFADLDIQARAHERACIHVFEYIQTLVPEYSKANTYFDVAITNCMALLSGRPSGWCAPALVQLGNTLKKHGSLSQNEQLDFFKQECAKIEWNTIRNLHKDLMFHRISSNKKPVLQTIVALLRQDESTRDAAILIRQIKNMRQGNTGNAYT